MEKATQRTKILEYMKQHGGITGLESTTVLHIMDYRKRISEMRRNGIPIADEWIVTDDGNRYKKYFIKEQA